MTHDESRTETVTKGTPSQNEMAELYRRAFVQFGTRALWNIQQVDNPTVEQILAIIRQVRLQVDAAAEAKVCGRDMSDFACAGSDDWGDSYAQISSRGGYQKFILMPP